MPTDANLERLSDHEVVQVLVGAGPRPLMCAETAMPGMADVLETLSSSDPSYMQDELGLTSDALLRLTAAVELHRRLLRSRRERAPMAEAKHVAAWMQPLLLRDHECLWCLALDSHRHLLGEPIQVSQGDVDSCEAGPRAFFRAALRRGASSAIAVHNHPSGDPSPSAADAAVTRRLVAAGRTVDVLLLDHVIVTANGTFVGLRRDQPELFR